MYDNEWSYLNKRNYSKFLEVFKRGQKFSDRLKDIGQNDILRSSFMIHPFSKFHFIF